MPLYEYRCIACGNRFEKIQSFSAEPLKECPKCGGVLERPLNAPAFQFKGAGWYINDYSSKGSGGSSSSVASAESSTASSEPSAARPAADASAPAAPGAPSASTSSAD